MRNGRPTADAIDRTTVATDTPRRRRRGVSMQRDIRTFARALLAGHLSRRGEHALRVVQHTEEVAAVAVEVAAGGV